MTTAKKTTRKKPKDPTSAKRAAALKDRLQAGGGTRMSLNLSGSHVKKLDRLVKAGVGKNHSGAIRQLIDDRDISFGGK